MKVLIIQHGIFPGYVAPIAKEYAKNLHKFGKIDVAVAVIGKRSPVSETEPFKFPIYSINEKNIILSYKKLIKIVREYDIVHYFPSKGYEFLPLFAPNTKFIFNRLSVSVTGRPIRNKLINILKRTQPVFSDCVLFTDEQLATKLKPFFNKKVYLLPVGYPSDLFYRCISHNNNEKILIYHGAVRPQRQLDQLVKTLSRLPNEYKLTIIGGGTQADDSYREYLGDLAKRLKCDDRLNLMNMPQDHIRSEIQKAYMGISYVPMWECYQDQFVLKTIEYLACHRPVLTTATRYSKRFRKNIGDQFILLTDGTVEDMVEKILEADEYINDFYKEENIRKLEDLLKCFSTEYFVKNRLLDIYRSVLSS